MEFKYKRYCDIMSCPNRKGTKSLLYRFISWVQLKEAMLDDLFLSIPFCRIPQSPVARQKWIDVIATYQDFDFCSPHFSVCNRHFKVDDFTAKGNLKKNSIPSVFSR